MTTTVPASVDAFLGGRVAAVQPVSQHHRAGLEAVLLASAVATDFKGTLVDLGAGSGVAGFAVAARCAEALVTLVERDRAVAECAEAGLALPENRDFSRRVRVVTADGLNAAEREAAGLAAGTADAVITNPPFHDRDGGTPPPDAPRAAAYVLEDGLDPWFRAAASLLKPRGALAVIFRADRLDALLAACRGRFGAITILPVAPRPHLAAARLILAAQKGSRAPLRLLPPMVLHGAVGNAYLPAAESLLRDGEALSDVHPAWPGLA